MAKNGYILSERYCNLTDNIGICFDISKALVYPGGNNYRYPIEIELTTGTN